MADTGVDNMYMVKELANEISLPNKKEKGYAKGANAKSLPIQGVARAWTSKLDYRDVRLI